MVHVTIQGNACHATSCTATVPHDRIHNNAGTKATVKFLSVVVVTMILLL